MNTFIPHTNNDQITFCIDLAVNLHGKQTRKYTGLPYILHPLRVMGEVAFHTSDPDVLAAAVLHDVCEDCNCSYEHLKDFLGVKIADLVKELTNPSKGSKESRAKRKAMDREHLRNASYWAKVIKALDRIDNLRDIRHSDDKSFIKLYCDESWKLLDEALSVDPNPIPEGLKWKLLAMIDAAINEHSTARQY